MPVYRIINPTSLNPTKINEVSVPRRANVVKNVPKSPSVVQNEVIDLDPNVPNKVQVLVQVKVRRLQEDQRLVLLPVPSAVQAVPVVQVVAQVALAGMEGPSDQTKSLVLPDQIDHPEEHQNLPLQL